MSRWLAPLGQIFGSLAACRAWLHAQGWIRQARLTGPVISVGNLSVGGTGKTPVVARIAELLRDEGRRVAILSRGYRGRFAGEALVVGDGTRVLASAGEAGDEPVMLAQALPGVVVAVGKRRDAVGRVVESRFGTLVHVLDDGFQHLRLARDLDLLCVDAGQPDGRPLPAGPFREFSSAARRADVVLLTQADSVDEETLRSLEERFGPEDTFRVGRRVEGFFDPRGRPSAPPARPFLLAGIARPERFEADVRGQVKELAGTLWFRDHHAWSLADIEGAAARARERRADALVTTAKDAVRLPGVVDEVWSAGSSVRRSGAGTDLPMLVFRVKAEIEDEARLKQRLLSATRNLG